MSASSIHVRKDSASEFGATLWLQRSIFTSSSSCFPSWSGSQSQSVANQKEVEACLRSSSCTTTDWPWRAWRTKFKRRRRGCRLRGDLKLKKSFCCTLLSQWQWQPVLTHGLGLNSCIPALGQAWISMKKGLPPIWAQVSATMVRLCWLQSKKMNYENHKR